MVGSYRINFTIDAVELLQEIRDRRIQSAIMARIKELPKGPELLGKALSEEFIGYRSLRAVGGRYRIVYGVDLARRIISIAAVGIRKAGDKKDVYSVLGKLIRADLLKEEDLE